jgi:hypothetical protein
VAATTVEVIGVKETLKELRALDPELRKQFARDIKQITKPLTDEAKTLYGRQMPSGFARTWNLGARPIFPWSVSKARSGVTTKITTSQRSKSVISVRQGNPAAAIIEFAGTRTSNSFATQTSLVFGRTRGKVMWQAADRRLEQINREVETAVETASAQIQRNMESYRWR